MGRLGIPILCGLVGAGCYLTMLTGSPGSAIFISLTQLPLFLAGLWLGAGAAALAGLTAATVIVATLGAVAGVFFAAADAVPVLLLVRQALLARVGRDGAVEWYSTGLLTGWLTAFALAGTGFGVWALGGPEAVESMLRQALAPDLTRLFGDDRHGLQVATGMLALVFPGMAAASWMMMTAFCAALAQGLLTRFGAGWRPTPDLAALDLPIWIPILFGAALAAAFFGGAARFLGVTGAVLLAVPLCFGGLAVLHTLARRFQRPAVLLMLFYVLAGLFGWPILVLALLGLLDAPLGLRRRLASPRSFGG